MSFFDEADEPRVARRSRPRGRRPSRSARTRPPGRRTIVKRRALAIVIVVLLVALGIHGCQTGESNSALHDYDENAAALIRSSAQTGSQLFSELSRGGGSANATKLQNQINHDRVNADSALARARSIAVPDELKQAQRYLLLALQMHRDALANIAGEIQPALKTSTSKDAIDALANDMARFYASDVLYSDYTVPAIVSALHAAGVAVGGGVNGVPIEGGRFLPNVDWLTAEYIALELGAPLPAPSVKPAPGVHGHRMDSVSVGATTLQAGATNTVPASPPPTFTCTFTNDGQNVETDVVVKVSVGGTSVSGRALVPQTTPGQQMTAAVTLNSSPPKGTYTVSANSPPMSQPALATGRPGRLVAMPTLVFDPQPTELEQLLQRRHELDQDRRDEVWEGVLHMIPPPSVEHERMAMKLVRMLGPYADAAGLEITGAIGIGGDQHDYRVPDAVLLRPGFAPQWNNTAALVVEIVSPGDKSWDKLAFYAAHHVDELLIIDPKKRTIDWLAFEHNTYRPVDRSRLIDLTAELLASRLGWTTRS